MTADQLAASLRVSLNEPLPLPGNGQTPNRLRRLMQIGRQNLCLARLAEAHWDAVAILSEAGRAPVSEALYGVWASEVPGQPLTAYSQRGRLTISGRKMFCSGAGLVDRAVVTVKEPVERLVEIDLRAGSDSLEFDNSAWKTNAFQETNTSTVTFLGTPISEESFVGGIGWYLKRPGFWHGACNPAACWAGGAAGLVEWAQEQKRNDSHTLAHLGAMQASVWAMKSYLDSAGTEIDQRPNDACSARIRALTLRHLAEQQCTDILRRFARAYGPSPLAMNERISRRYHELDLYLRQSHAERDLEDLGEQSQCIVANRTGNRESES